MFINEEDEFPNSLRYILCMRMEGKIIVNSDPKTMYGSSFVSIFTVAGNCWWERACMEISHDLNKRRRPCFEWRKLYIYFVLATLSVREFDASQ